MIFEFGWDKLEKYTYILGLIISLALTISKGKILPHNISKSLIEKKKKYLFNVYEFDNDEYDRLKKDIEMLREELGQDEFYLTSSNFV